MLKIATQCRGTSYAGISALLSQNRANGCATPARVERDIRDKWIGQPIEAFESANIQVGEHAYLRMPEPMGEGKLRYVFSATEKKVDWFLGPRVYVDAECLIDFTVDESSHAIEEIRIVKNFPGLMANNYCASKVH